MNTFPRVRSGVKIIPREDAGGEARFFLKDPQTGAVFEIGELEFYICGLLDGQTPPEAVRQKVLERFGTPLSARDFDAFLTQLSLQGLLVAESIEPGNAPADENGAQPAAPAPAPAPAAAVVAGDGRGGWLGRVVSWPLRAFLRYFVIAPWDLLSLAGGPDLSPPRTVKLFNPDPLIARASRAMGWIFSNTFLLLSLLVIVPAFSLLVAEWSRFWHVTELFWKPRGFVLLVLVGVFCVHIPHQLMHALACARFGGCVRVCGLRFLFHAIPTFYCDVREAMWFPEKRARMRTVFAGIHYQLLTFSAGMLGWWIATPGTGAGLFWVALAGTSLFGLLLNVNPAAKRDMYYLLAAGLEIKGLRSRSRAYLRAWVRWEPVPEPLTYPERRWFVSYALLANAYGVLIAVFAGLLGYRQLVEHRENGFFFVALAAGLVFQDHVRVYLDRAPFHALMRFGRTVAGGAAAVALVAGLIVVMLLPYPYEAGGPFELLPAKSIEIRSDLEGLVEDVLVEEGQWVESGQPVVSLLKGAHERNLKAAEAQLAEAQARREVLLSGAKPEEIARARQAVKTVEAEYVWSAARAARYRRLHDEQLVSRQEYENAIQIEIIDGEKLEEARAALAVVQSAARPAAVEALDAEVRSLEAITDYYRTSVERTLITSPMAGQIVTPRVAEIRGQYLKPGQKDLVLEIVDSRTIRAEMEVPEEDLAGIGVGARVKVLTWAYPDQMFYGSVSAIAPVAKTNDELSWKIVRVTTEIPNPDGLLKPEMTGHAKIATESLPVWKVLSRPIVRWFRIEVWSWLP